ncbi:MAG: EamA family transporter [Dehalococcoidia bacterium]|nr:EamA family transporter [Dehalococcoidia bacterium]
MSTKAALALLGVGLIWGTSFLFIRIAVEDVTPMQLVFLRSVPGALTLLAITRLQRRSLDLDAGRLRIGLLLAVAGTLVPFFLIAWAEQEIESGAASVLNATLPLFVIVIATAFLPDERLTTRRAIGIAMGLLGVLILVGSDLRDLASSSLLAQAAMLASSALYAVSAVVTRVALRGWHATSLSTVQISIVAVLTTPLVLATGTPSFDFAWDVWLAIACLGVLGTGVAYIAYYWLIENVGTVRASLVAYIIPVVGVTAGAIVLDEHIGWNTLAGGGVILLGVAIVNRAEDFNRWRRRTAAAKV